MDQSKKTMRHFYCRDVLWETFEQMANDFDCSIDYLVNEAMRYYARSKNYQSAMAVGGAGTASGIQTAAHPAQGFPGTSNGGGASVPRRPAVTNPPPTPGVPRKAAPSLPPPLAAPNSEVGGPGFPGVDLPTSANTLYLIYNDERFAITKDQFIIGRGSRTADLPIKDGNISRKHAAVIRRNGTYYIKDLGSTNGIDYKGMRIDNKRIDEGDVFHLCDYELRFTYHTE